MILADAKTSVATNCSTYQGGKHGQMQMNPFVPSDDGVRYRPTPIQSHDQNDAYRMIHI